MALLPQGSWQSNKLCCAAQCLAMRKHSSFPKDEPALAQIPEGLLTSSFQLPLSQKQQSVQNTTSAPQCPICVAAQGEAWQDSCLHTVGRASHCLQIAPMVDKMKLADL